jgi:cobalt transport protein
LAYAMECRCYRGGDGRTKMKIMKFHARDYISLAAVIIFIALLVSFNFIFTKVI